MTRTYLIAIFSSLIASLILTPLSIKLASRFGAIDKLGARKIHRGLVPRWGGIGIMGGFFCAFVVLWLFVPSFQNLIHFSKGMLRDGNVIFTLNLGEQLAGILFGVIVLFVLGLVDDRKPVKPGIKFLIQIIAAFVAMIYGVRIYGLSIPGLESYRHFPTFVTMVVTILWLVGISNAVNLIDGLDGLAGGVVAIVAGAFLGVTLIQGAGHSPLFQHQMELAGIIASALLGGTLGFLVFNFNPARVFMGDSGSLCLGFIVGCVAVIGTFKTTILAVLVVPFILVAVPVMDMTMAFLRRLLNKKSPFEPDRSHLHHKLLDAGWSQREVVLMIYVVTLVLALISVTVVGIQKI
jgi:UDP-GlcNAc:undecaprenyl-phosphate GlcNAc-1-phosphate transferase